MRFSITSAAIASAFILKVASAQQPIYPEWDPSDIDENLKSAWCTTQEATCPLLCYDRDTIVAEEGNYCETENLTYQCICDDGQAPDLDVYSQTIPYFKCTHQVTQCVENCNGISVCAQRCREDNPCGAQDPPRLNNTETPTKTGSNSEPSSSPTGGFKAGFGEDEEDDKKSSASMGKNLGLATMMLGLGAGFAFFL